eukprot:tig00020830_g14470.t1
MSAFAAEVEEVFNTVLYESIESTGWRPCLSHGAITVEVRDLPDSNTLFRVVIEYPDIPAEFAARCLLSRNRGVEYNEADTPRP